MTSEMRMSGAGYRLAGRAKTRVLRTALPLGAVCSPCRGGEGGENAGRGGVTQSANQNGQADAVVVFCLTRSHGVTENAGKVLCGSKHASVLRAVENLPCREAPSRSLRASPRLRVERRGICRQNRNAEAAAHSIGCLPCRGGEVGENARLDEVTQSPNLDDLEMGVGLLRRLGDVAGSRTFRNTLSTPSAADSEFSPKPIERAMDGQGKRRGRKFAESDAFFGGSVDRADKFRLLPFPSAHSVVKKNQEAELLCYHKYRPCG
jgi:hypothetical protein